MHDHMDATPNVRSVTEPHVNGGETRETPTEDSKQVYNLWTPLYGSGNWGLPEREKFPGRDVIDVDSVEVK